MDPQQRLLLEVRRTSLPPSSEHHSRASLRAERGDPRDDCSWHKYGHDHELTYDKAMRMDIRDISVDQLLDMEMLARLSYTCMTVLAWACRRRGTFWRRTQTCSRLWWQWPLPS